MRGKDACFSPVLSPAEAVAHPHMQTRAAHVQVDGMAHPAPAPCFSGTPSAISTPPSDLGQHSEQALQHWGFGAEEIAELMALGAIA